MLVGAGELVEQGRLAAVLVARQRKGQGLALRQGMLALFGVVASAFAQTRMLHHLVLPPGGCSGGRGRGRGDLDLRCVVQTQGQFIAVDLQLHGVAHGRKLHQRDLFAGDQPHVQKMLPQGSRPAHCVNNGTFADLQFF